MRGYREKELIADWFVLNTLEWTNSSFGSVNMPYVFLDYPFSDNIKVGSSYGFGIKNINDNFSFDIVKMELPEITGETFEAIEWSQIILPESFKAIIFILLFKSILALTIIKLWSP